MWNESNCTTITMMVGQQYSKQYHIYTTHTYICFHIKILILYMHVLFFIVNNIYTYTFNTIFHSIILFHNIQLLNTVFNGRNINQFH